MAVSHICTDRRKRDSNLKTQIRFGQADIEIFTKYKGSKEGYRMVDMSDFLYDETLPQFDHNIKWKRKQDKPARRFPTYRNATNTPEPTSGKERSILPVMVRQLSSTGKFDTEAKRPRIQSKPKTGYVAQ